MQSHFSFNKLLVIRVSCWMWHSLQHCLLLFFAFYAPKEVRKSTWVLSACMMKNGRKNTERCRWFSIGRKKRRWEWRKIDFLTKNYLTGSDRLNKVFLPGCLGNVFVSMPETVIWRFPSRFLKPLSFLSYRLRAFVIISIFSGIFILRRNKSLSGVRINHTNVINQIFSNMSRKLFSENFLLVLRIQKQGEGKERQQKKWDLNPKYSQMWRCRLRATRRKRRRRSKKVSITLSWTEIY